MDSSAAIICLTFLLALDIVSANPAVIDKCVVATPSVNSARGTNHLPGREGTPLYRLSVQPLVGERLAYRVLLSGSERSDSFRDAYVSIQVVGDKTCGAGELQFDPHDFSRQAQRGANCPTLVSSRRKSAMQELPALVWVPPVCGCVQIRALVMDDKMTYGEDSTVTSGPLAQMACVPTKNKTRYLDTLCQVVDRHGVASILSRGSFLSRHNLQVAWMDRYGLEMALELRKSDARFCCSQGSSIGRMQCFENSRRRRIDRFCADGYPDVPFTSFRDAHMRSLERKCCTIMGPRRYQCFSPENATVSNEFTPLDFSMEETDPTNDLAIFGDEQMDTSGLSSVQFKHGLTIGQFIDKEADQNHSSSKPHQAERVKVEDTTQSGDSDDNEKNKGETTGVKMPKPGKKPPRSRKAEDDVTTTQAATAQKPQSSRRSKKIQEPVAKSAPSPKEDPETVEKTIPEKKERLPSISPDDQTTNQKSEGVTSSRRQGGSTIGRKSSRGRVRQRSQERRRSGRKRNGSKGSRRRFRSKEFQDGQMDAVGSKRTHSAGRSKPRRHDGASSAGFEKWYFSRGCCKSGQSEGRHVIGHSRTILRQCEAGASKSLEEIPMEWGLEVHRKCWESFMSCCQSQAVRGLEMTSSEFQEYYPEMKGDPLQDPNDHDWVEEETFDPRGETRYKSMREELERAKVEEQEEEEVGEEEFTGPMNFDDVDNDLAEMDDELMRGTLIRETSHTRTPSRTNPNKDNSDEDSEEDLEDEDEAFERDFGLRLESTDLDLRPIRTLESPPGRMERKDLLAARQKQDKKTRRQGLRHSKGKKSLQDNNAGSKMSKVQPEEDINHPRNLRQPTHDQVPQSPDRTQTTNPRKEVSHRTPTLPSEPPSQTLSTDLPNTDPLAHPLPTRSHSRRRQGRRGGRSKSQRRSRRKSRESRRASRASRRSMRRRSKKSQEKRHLSKSRGTKFSRAPLDMGAAHQRDRFYNFHHDVEKDSREQREAFTRRHAYTPRNRRSRIW